MCGELKVISVGVVRDEFKKNERWIHVLFICLTLARSGL